MNGMIKLKTVIVTGENGIIAKEIKQNFSKKINILFFDKKKLDISNFNLSYKICKKIKPNLIINTAAYTDTESAEINKIIVKKANITGVKNLVKIAKLLNIKLIHFSSDYIFDGKKKIPYKEIDNPNPLNYYGKSKLASEVIIRNSYLKKSMIIRTSLLYSQFNNNLLKNILYNLKINKDLKFVNDIICSPTSAKSLAKFLNHIVITNSFHSGIYNFCDRGQCSNYEFAIYIYKRLNELKLLKTKSTISQIASNVYKSKINRPKYSSLDNKKLIKKFNFKINYWKKNLSLILNKSLQNLIIERF